MDRMLFIQNDFCKYFLPVSGFSYFPDSTFCRTEVLHFNKVKYQLFLFINHTFDVVSKKSLSYPRSSRFFSFLSSRSFIVLHFTFKSMIHFELIIVKCVKLCLDFFFSFCLAIAQLFQYHLLKRLSFLCWITFASLLKISWLYLWESVSGLSIVFQWFICLFFCQ